MALPVPPCRAGSVAPLSRPFMGIATRVLPLQWRRGHRALSR